jgi:integrase
LSTIYSREFQLLLAELEDPYKTMVLVAGCLGLRVSELMGLQWGDIDWSNLVVRIRRSSVEGRVYESPKTEESRKPVPLDPDLAQVLSQFRQGSSYGADSDFVFAGDRGGPRCQGILLTDHIKPAAARAGIGKIGWHTLRHTFATLLHDSKAPLAVQKELLRHADIQTTMNIYTQAVGERKRQAASRVVKMLLKR